MTNSKRVASYGRVSTAEQAESGTSLEDQSKTIALFAKNNGWALVDSYVDGGVSGGSTNRPELQRMREDAKAGKFDAILFTKLDRLGRTLLDLEYLYKEFEQLGIELVCVSDPSLNSGGKMGKVIRALMGTFAEFERETIRERTSGGRKIKWRNGTAFIGDVPYGYEREYAGGDKKKPTGKIVINEAHAKVYRKIVSLYLDERMGTEKIAIELTKAGVPTPTTQKGRKIKAGSWNQTTILNMLHSSAYMGEMVYNKTKYVQPKDAKPGRHRFVRLKNAKPESEWVTVKFPPVIEKARWQQIQARLKTQKTKAKKQYKNYPDGFLFSDLLYCGECGAKMSKAVKREKDGTERLYYRCFWTAANKFTNRTCILHSSNANEVDRQLYKQLVDLLVEPKSLIHTWFADVDFEKLKEKVALLEEKDRLLQKKIMDGFTLITGTDNQKMQNLYRDAQKKLEAEFEKTQLDLTNAKRELENAAAKNQRYESFKKALTTPPNGLMGKLKIEGTLRQFLENLPFAEKKRLIEAVVSPEQGGKCFLKYVRPTDYLSEEELKAVPKSKWNEPQKDRPPYAYADFLADFDTIETVVNSLNRDGLLDKASFDGVCTRQAVGGSADF